MFDFFFRLCYNHFKKFEHYNIGKLSIFINKRFSGGKYGRFDLKKTADDIRFFKG